MKHFLLVAQGQLKSYLMHLLEQGGRGVLSDMDKINILKWDGSYKIKINNMVHFFTLNKSLLLSPSASGLLM